MCDNPSTQRLILGSAKVASYFLTPMITIGREQRHCDRGGGGGLPPRFSFASGSGKASLHCLRWC